MKKKTLLSWSSGKDSAWALHVLRQDPEIELVGLFTVINEKYERASMHATRIAMLDRQAEKAGLPIETVSLPDRCTDEECNGIMETFIRDVETRGIECVAFGDLYLEDIRQYRENQLKLTTLEPLFPLWRIPTRELADQMLAGGLQAYVSSVDLAKLPKEFAGRKWDRQLLRDIPAECDPCGENGEMHTIVTGGPMFTGVIPVRVGEIVTRGDFAYADIIPGEIHGSLPDRTG